MEVYCSVSCVPIQLIISLILCPYVCGNLFKEVSYCPLDENEWRDRAQKKDCKEPIPDFMCAAIENQQGRFGEICTFVGLTGKDECVVLDADTYNLNFVKCYATFGCPPRAYISSYLFKYPVCYNYSRETTTSISTTEQHEQITTRNPEKSKQDGSSYAIAISTFIVFLGVFLLLIFWIKRKISKRKAQKFATSVPGFKDLENNATDGSTTSLLNTESGSKVLSILGAYMKFQLIDCFKVKNLRFLMVTHSDSLKHHFKENFDRIINSSSVDWTKVDLDNVYVLLSNFCGIPSPDRGWGYKPTDKDFSVGADIERIRILVNEYLDNKKFEIKEAEQVLERWRWLKKDVDSRDIIDFDHETKISYIKVKPDNVVEHGTVVTRAIENILEKLKTKRIVTCRGAIGCGKTTALKYVATKYKNDGWTIKWIKGIMDESFFNSVIESNSDKIIICCDNLFGSFGSHVFSGEMFQNFHYFMRRILQSGHYIKVLLGIHEHVFEEISSKHSLVWQDYVFVDLDNLSQSEALQIYIMQHEHSNIKQEYIQFDNFLELIENRSANVGTPFQTLMISAASDVFGTKAFYNQPFQFLAEHFSKLLSRDEEMFFSLLYVMCVVIFDKKDDELKSSIANAINPCLDKNTIEHYLPKLAPYIQNDVDTVEIKHEVISIALIHTFMMELKKPWSIFSAYDIRGILELIRPDNQAEKLHQIALPLSKEMLDEAKTVLKTKIVRYYRPSFIGTFFLRWFTTQIECKRLLLQAFVL